MFEELGILIEFILKEYNKVFNQWKKNELYQLVNQKNKLVKELIEDEFAFKNILNYRLFLNEQHIGIKLKLEELNLRSEINSRVKAQNSIEYKLNNYMSEKHENGNIPLNKCFNDLYGIRIIFNDNVNYSYIKTFVETKYNGKLKCIDASKDDYIATHIYFKENNYSFQWELQIWDRQHYKSNLKSHELYKQSYAKWEKVKEAKK